MYGRRTRRSVAWLLATMIGGGSVLAVLAPAPVSAQSGQTAPPSSSVPASAPESGAVSGSTTPASGEEVTQLDTPRGRRGGGRGGRKRLLLAQLMTLLTLAASAGAAYAVYYVRKLRATIPRLQDAISGQARQLAELRRQLADRAGSGGGAGGGSAPGGARGTPPGR